MPRCGRGARLFLRPSDRCSRWPCWSASMSLPALVVGLASFAVWLWAVYPTELAHSVSGMAITVAAGLVAPLWRIVRTRPASPACGSFVDDLAAPALWPLAPELPAPSGTRPPDRIARGPGRNL